MPKKSKGKSPGIKTTKCILCGKTIQYKTKMPSKCSQCKDVNPTAKLNPKTKWKKETQMVRAMGELLPDVEYIVNGYYSWLPSPKGMPLQIDWYCPTFNIGVEMDGPQHYEYVKYFHKTKKEFLYLQECDAIKARLCKERGVTLLHVPYNSNITVKDMGELFKKTDPVLYNTLLKANMIREV